jgi:Ca2+-binding EF-hand superfamily protein
LKKIKSVLLNEKIDYEMAFKTMDIDRDNYLSLEDFKISFIMMNIKISPDQLENLIFFLD